MQHETHQMHTNSLLAFRQEQPKLDERKKAVLSVVETIGPVSDRQICELLGYTDMNMVRPRVTELVQSGRLVEVFKAVDPRTRKSVRIVALPNSLSTQVEG